MDNLNPKQDSFCIHYTTIGSETYSNGTKAAIATRYSEKSAHVQANNLLKQDAIWERIRELTIEHMKRNNITIDKVLADLEHDKLLARKARQYGVAKACTELQGRWLAMFTDRKVNVNPEEEQVKLKLIEAEQQKYEKYTRLRTEELAVGRIN